MGTRTSARGENEDYPNSCTHHVFEEFKKCDRGWNIRISTGVGETSIGGNFEIELKQISNPEIRNLKLDFAYPRAKFNLRFRISGFEICFRTISKFLIVPESDNGIDSRSAASGNPTREGCRDSKYDNGHTEG